MTDASEMASFLRENPAYEVVGYTLHYGTHTFELSAEEGDRAHRRIIDVLSGELPAGLFPVLTSDGQYWCAIAPGVPMVLEPRFPA